MSDKPDAMRIADELEAGDNFFAESSMWFDHKLATVAGEAADELRRLHKENERLTNCLKMANDQAERFEREWYLRGDQIDELVEALQGMMKLYKRRKADHWGEKTDEVKAALAALANVDSPTSNAWNQVANEIHDCAICASINDSAKRICQRFQQAARFNYRCPVCVSKPPPN